MNSSEHNRYKQLLSRPGFKKDSKISTIKIDYEINIKNNNKDNNDESNNNSNTHNNS